MSSDIFLEWLNSISRWIHIFAGIMWVGQTYFFTWLDGRFHEMTDEMMSAGKNPDDHVWMVHSGGFYLVGKQKMPKLMPTRLHWFRWEAMITWLSGISLIVLVYYVGGLMVDEEMSETVPMIAGIGTILLAWPVYDLLWRSKIGANETLGVIVSYVLIVGVAIILTNLMDGRAAYLHLGAMMGTLMTLNVWMRILPAQKKMVTALHEKRDPDLTLAAQARTRSKHNTFMAVPVVFLMISNHYPVTTYGADLGWIVLAIIVLLGWGAAKIIRRA